MSEQRPLYVFHKIDIFVVIFLTPLTKFFFIKTSRTIFRYVVVVLYMSDGPTHNSMTIFDRRRPLHQ